MAAGSKGIPDEKSAGMQTPVEVEEATGRLYEEYGRLFPVHEEFWLGLTVEKADQASLILDLINMQKSGGAIFHEDSRMTDYAKSTLARLKDDLKKAKERRLSFNDALSNALDIEKSLAGHRFHRMFGGGSPEVRHILELLDSYSENRVKALQTELKHRHTQ